MESPGLPEPAIASLRHSVIRNAASAVLRFFHRQYLFMICIFLHLLSVGAHIVLIVSLDERERPYDPRPYDRRYRDYERDGRRGGPYEDYRGGGGRYEDRDRYRDYDRRYDDRRY